MKIQNNKKTLKSYKKEFPAIVGVAITATVLAILFGHSVTATSSTQDTNVQLLPSADNAFHFGLPDGVVDGKHYSRVIEGGMPEASIAKGTTVSLPIKIISASTEPITVKFSTTFGDQLGLPKMPPGIHVTIEPNIVKLQPGDNTIINMVVQGDLNALDGTYMQNIVGTWGNGPSDFLGSAVSLKIGVGTPHFLKPSDVGQ